MVNAQNPKAFSKWCRAVRSEVSKRESCCVISDHPLQRPDPGIYSQEEQIALGTEPTWDSPDITTASLGRFQLLPETEVRIRNLSASVSAVNVFVHLSFSAFGIGTQKNPLSTKVVSLTPGGESLLHFPLSRELLAGDQRVGAHVVIDHPFDSVRINNRGSQVIFGELTSEAGRDLRLHFPVVNDSGTSQSIALTILPNELAAMVSPDLHSFVSFEEIIATLYLRVPDTLHGSPDAVVRRDVTVIGHRLDGGLVGGLTYIVQVDN